MTHPTPSVGARLLADGVKVTLGDGQEYEFRFGFKALLRVEDEFGSLQAFLDVIQDPDFAQRRLNPIYTGLLCALTHYGRPDSEWAALFDFRQMQAYLTAISQAFRQAMPEPQPGEAAAPAETASPGASSTTVPPSVGAAQMVSSGA